jgi:hypothetical protein
VAADAGHARFHDREHRVITQFELADRADQLVRRGVVTAPGRSAAKDNDNRCQNRECDDKDSSHRPKNLCQNGAFGHSVDENISTEAS